MIYLNLQIVKIKNIFENMQINHSTKGASLAHYNVIAPNVRPLEWRLI
jgi:hypothetical protein